MKKRIFPLILLGSILLITSCGTSSGNNQLPPHDDPIDNPDNPNTGTTTPENPLEVKIELTLSKTVFEVDEEITYELLSNQTYDKTKVSFKFDKTCVLLDTSTNKIKGVSVGKTTIELYYENNLQTKTEIQVIEKSILPTLIKTNFSRKIIGVNEELQLDVSFEPVDVNKKELLFKSTDPSVISVSNTGLIKGVAVGSASIMISTKCGTANTIILSLAVSNNETEVNNDLLVSLKDVASENEIKDINAGKISIKTKTKNSTEKTFSNEYSIFDDHIYNVINDYDGTSYKLFHGIKDGTLYTLRKVGEETTYRKSLRIIKNDGMPFGNEIKMDDANTCTYLPSILVDKYSEEFTHGVKGLVNHILGFYFSNQYQDSMQVTFKDSVLKMMSFNSSYLGDTKNELTIIFKQNRYKNLIFSSKTYEIGSIDKEGNVAPNSIVNEYYEANATLEIGPRIIENNPSIDMSKLFFNDFELDFYESTDLKTPKTRFAKGATITYRVKEKTPSEADPYIDLIEIESVSDPTVLGISPNKQALNALKEGVSEVTFKSRNVKKTYQIEVFEIAAQGFNFSSGLKDIMSSNDKISFFVDSIPFGSKNDAVVTLSEGGEKYVTLSSEIKNGTMFYYLEGNKEMVEKEATFEIIATSKSNPDVKTQKKIKIVKALNDKEIFDNLIAYKYISEPNPDYYNKKLEIIFNEDRSGEVIIFNNSGTIFDSCKFTYTINKGKISIIGGNAFSVGYLTDLKVEVKDADLSSINVRVTDAIGGEDDGIAFTFIAYREKK